MHELKEKLSFLPLQKSSADCSNGRTSTLELLFSTLVQRHVTHQGFQNSKHAEEKTGKATHQRLRGFLISSRCIPIFVNCVSDINIFVTVNSPSVIHIFFSCAESFRCRCDVTIWMLKPLYFGDTAGVFTVDTWVVAMFPAQLCSLA